MRSYPIYIIGDSDITDKNIAGKQEINLKILVGKSKINNTVLGNIKIKKRILDDNLMDFNLYIDNKLIKTIKFNSKTNEFLHE